MLLDVAMEESETRLIGSEIDDGATVVGHNHGVFDGPEVGLSLTDWSSHKCRCMCMGCASSVRLRITRR